MRHTALLVVAAFASCQDWNRETGESAKSPELAGAWRVASQRIFYDAGGGGSVTRATSRPLELLDDGSWAYGDSQGSWSVAPIEEPDWTTWNCAAYGPKRKIVLHGWNGGVASGPLEEADGRVDFVWVIHRIEPPSVSSPGVMHIKLGR